MTRTTVPLAILAARGGLRPAHTARVLEMRMRDADLTSELVREDRSCGCHPCNAPTYYRPERVSSPSYLRHRIRHARWFRWLGWAIALAVWAGIWWEVGQHI